MAIDENFAQRIRKLLNTKGIKPIEKRMFGGIAFMINGNMAVGLMNTGDLMARVGKDQNEAALKLPGAHQMSFKKPMLGYINVNPSALATDSDLEKWINICLNFNQTLPKK